MELTYTTITLRTYLIFLASTGFFYAEQRHKGQSLYAIISWVYKVRLI